MKSRTSAAVAFACATSLIACESSTMIRTNVPGAKVFLDGAYVGVTPFNMSDTKIVGSSTAVRIEAVGYAPANLTIKRSEEFDVTACIGGVFLLVPFLWVMGYKAEHDIELTPGYGDPNQQGYPPAQGGYPPPQGGYPPPQGGYPPPQGGYPPPQGGYPPPQGGYPPPQGGYPPPQGGYPPPQGGYPPPQQPQGGYPPPQGGYPPPQQPQYPPPQGR